MQNSRGSAFKKSNSPNKITTMRTKCWLTQEGCHKLVTIHLMNTSSHRTTTTIHEGLFLVCATMRHLILSTFYKFIYKNIKIMTGRKKNCVLPCDHRKSIFTCKRPEGSKSTQKSV